MRNTENLNSLIVNTRIASIRPIEVPIQLKERIPNNSADLVVKTRQGITDILHGRDTKRLVMIVGPCSIHDPKQAIEYAERLVDVKKQLEDNLVIVMRTYFEKPRTTIGWKGLVYAPNLDGRSKAGAGLAISRQILADINNLGIPCAMEALDLLSPQYFDDLVSWTAIGARTTTSQTHRQLASGLSTPIGFKNSTEGNIKVAVDAMESAATNHLFYSINEYGHIAEVETTGNPDTHIVLRGGDSGTNYDEVSVKKAITLIQKQGLLTEINRLVMIDCSHANSAKDHTKQLSVAKNVLAQFQSGQFRIMGMLIESNLVAGSQKFVAGEQLEYGKSITDACIGWKETESLLVNSAQMLRSKGYVLS